MRAQVWDVSGRPGQLPSLNAAHLHARAVSIRACTRVHKCVLLLEQSHRIHLTDVWSKLLSRMDEKLDFWLFFGPAP